MLLAPGDLSAVGFRHSGLAISCEQANKGERWERGCIFSRQDWNTQVCVCLPAVLCVSLAKGVDTVCRELPLRCRWSYYVWCGRGGGLVSEGVNRYVTAPEALCVLKRGEDAYLSFFILIPFIITFSLSFWASQRGLDVERDIWLGLRNMRNCIWADSKPGSVASHLKYEKSHGNNGEDDIRGSDV